MAEKIPTLLQRLETAARSRKLEKFTDASYDWFRSKVRTIGGERARKEVLDDARRTRKYISDPSTQPGIGYMYTYVYDAKWKDKLPYWDAFPLIFLVGPAKNGWYGINLHYLSPRYRAVLMDKLIELASDKRYTSRTKLNMTYQLLKSTQNYSLFKPCFKRYLNTQLQSRMVKIDSDDWEAALFLPTANFKKSNNSKVWAESIMKV